MTQQRAGIIFRDGRRTTKLDPVKRSRDTGHIGMHGGLDGRMVVSW